MHLLFNPQISVHFKKDVTLFFRSVKEAWIKAKYVEKRFVSKLLSVKSSSDTEVKGWRVKKKTRRSPGPASSKQGEQLSPDSPESDVTSGLLEGINTILGNTHMYRCCHGSQCFLYLAFFK